MKMFRTKGFDGVYYILESGGGVTPINKRAFDVINRQNNFIKKLQTRNNKNNTIDAEEWYKENEGKYNLYNDPDEMVIDAFNAGRESK